MSTIKSSAENLTLNADGANNDIKFQSNGTEVASIDQAGTITATTFTGSVTSGTTSTFTSTQAATNADILKLNATQTNSSSNLKFQINGGSTAQGQIRLGGNNDISIHNTSSDTERVRILSSGGITFNGDTAAANALDDYEYGTFTPNVINNGSTSTWSTKAGQYLKVGSLVNVWVVCDSGNSGTAGTYLEVTGLPFTINNSNSVMTTGIWGTNGTTARSGNTVFGSRFYTGGGEVTQQATFATLQMTYYSTA